jgi:hypothetical protein
MCIFYGLLFKNLNLKFEIKKNVFPFVYIYICGKKIIILCLQYYNSFHCLVINWDKKIINFMFINVMIINVIISYVNLS